MARRQLACLAVLAGLVALLVISISRLGDEKMVPQVIRRSFMDLREDPGSSTDGSGGEQAVQAVQVVQGVHADHTVHRRSPSSPRRPSSRMGFAGKKANGSQNSLLNTSPSLTDAVQRRPDRKEMLALELANTWRSRERPCRSPEFGQEWIVGRCPRHASLLSGTSSSTCGLCAQNAHAVAFQKLADQLKATKSKECWRLVVYSAVFGKDYYKKYQDGARDSMERRKKSRDNAGQYADALHKAHSHCFITFVIREDLGTHSSLPNVSSPDGIDVIIPVRAEVLPYLNHRRNVKIFKMLGPFLFPWAARLLWQDGEKFRRKAYEAYRPTNYFLYFAEAIERRNVCAAFTQAPRHASYFGNAAENLPHPRLDLHCKTIVEASTARDSTDGRNALVSQCRHYYNHSLNAKAVMNSYSRLIDSAFIAWDGRTARCRQFNAKLGCTWLDEVHCFSDRDQVSFPVALASMGVRDEKADIAWFKDRRILLDSEDRPIVHMISPICHWYYHSEDVNTCIRRPKRPNTFAWHN